MPRRPDIDRIHELAGDLESWAMRWEEFVEEVERLEGLVDDWTDDPIFRRAEDAVLFREELDATERRLDTDRRALVAKMEKVQAGVRSWARERKRLPRALQDQYNEVVG